MNVTVKPGVLRGEIPAPLSKSYAHRLLIGAALADGESVIDGIAGSEDLQATLDCICAVGAKVTEKNATVTVQGAAVQQRASAHFPCRESGSTLRFFLPIALLSGKPAVFSGTKRLIERGIQVYEQLLTPKGITFQRNETSITVNGKLSAGVYTVPGNISSQFISGLLFALPLCQGESRIQILPPVESRSYIDITLDVLRQFGIEIDEPQPNLFVIKGGQHYRPCHCTVEGDWSNAAALLGFHALGGEVRLTGLNPNSKQGDRVCVSLLEKLKNKTDPTVDLSDCPDLAPILFAVAAATGPATFTGTKRLQIKESDRANAMAEELKKFGVRTEVAENRVRVYGGRLFCPTVPLSGHNDHRIVMAMTLLASKTGGTVTDAESVAKSFPDYFDRLSALGLEVCYET